MPNPKILPGTKLWLYIVFGAVIVTAVIVGGVLFGDYKPPFDYPTFGGSKPSILYSYAANDAGDDFVPSIAYGNGKWMVVWQSNDDLNKGKKNNDDILFASSTNGQSWSPPKVPYKHSELDIGNDEAPHLATDGKNNWFVVWSSEANINGKIKEDYDILGVRSSDNGVNWEDLAPVNRNADTDSSSWCPYGCVPGKKEDDWYPRVATDGKIWHVVWVGSSTVLNVGGCGDYSSKGRIYTQQTDNILNQPNIQWLGPYCKGSSGITHCSINPAIAGNGVGNWVLTYVSDVPGSSYSSQYGTPDFDLYFACTSDSSWASFNHPWSLSSYLCDYALEDNHCYFPCHDRQPAIAANESTWMVVWSSAISSLELDGTTMQLGNDYDLLVAVSQDKGQTWSPPRPVNTNAESDAGDDKFAAIATDGTNWVVVWASNETLKGKGTDYDIYAATSKDGKTWTTLQSLQTNLLTDTGDDTHPQIATDGNKWVVVWNSDEDGGTGPDYDIIVADFVLPLP